MERELRGTWTDAIVDHGRGDKLILDFMARLEDERLVGWQVELRTERCPGPIRLAPPTVGEPVCFDHRLSRDLIVRGVLRCLRLSRSTVFIEAGQLSYGFEDAPIHTVLGRLVQLVEPTGPAGAEPHEPLGPSRSSE